MALNPNLWKTLKPGDCVRLAEWPSEFDAPNYRLPDETRVLHERLIASRQVLRIDHLVYYDSTGQFCEASESVDGQSYPWTEWFVVDGLEGSHVLMIDGSGYELVA